MFVFLLGINNAKALDVSQVSLKVEDKSSTITVLDDGIGTLKVNPKLEFNVVGDYITYKLVLKNNDGKKFKVEEIKDNNTNEHIKVEYDYNKELNTENKEILITLKYDKKITNVNTELKSISVKIKLIDEEDKTEEVNINGGNDKSGKNNEGAKGKNPQTGDNIKIHVWWLFISLIGVVLSIIYLIKNKGKKYSKGMLSILLLISLVPTIVIGSETKEITFNINFENIKINIRHKVEFDTKGGNEIDTQVIDNNEKAMKPSNPEKTGYNFVKWVDKNGNEYTDDSLFYTFKKDTSLTAVWKMHEGVIAKPGNMAQSLLSIKDTAGDVLADDDPDGNLRYYGNCANNYVNFNNQRWRIIGVFDVDDGSGKIESRVKLVREGNINGVWDTSDSSVNSGQGINQWGPSTYTNGDLYEGSDLMRLLNDHYLKYMMIQRNISIDIVGTITK